MIFLFTLSSLRFIFFVPAHPTICGLHLFLRTRLFLWADLRPVLLTTVHRMSLQYTCAYVQNLVTLAWRNHAAQRCLSLSLFLFLEKLAKMPNFWSNLLNILRLFSEINLLQTYEENKFCLKLENITFKLNKLIIIIIPISIKIRMKFRFFSKKIVSHPRFISTVSSVRVRRSCSFRRFDVYHVSKGKWNYNWSWNRAFITRFINGIREFQCHLTCWEFELSLVEDGIIWIAWNFNLNACLSEFIAEVLSLGVNYRRNLGSNKGVKFYSNNFNFL